MFYIGDRVRIIKSGILRHIGQEGVINKVYEGPGAGMVMVRIDGEGSYNYTGPYLQKIEQLTSLSEGYGRCGCGAITSNKTTDPLVNFGWMRFVCCDCKKTVIVIEKEKEQLPY